MIYLCKKRQVLFAPLLVTHQDPADDQVALLVPAHRGLAAPRLAQALARPGRISWAKRVETARHLAVEMG